MSRSDLSHHPINLSFASEGKVFSLAQWMEAENQLPSKFIYLLRGGCQPVDYKPHALPVLLENQRDSAVLSLK